MRILRVNIDDTAMIDGCLAVHRAAQQAEDPVGPPKSARALRTFLDEGYEGNPCEAWLVVDAPGGGADDDPAAGDGRAVGLCWLQLPDKENLTRAELLLLVRPDAAGQDVLAAMLRHAARRARASGRVIFSVLTRHGTPTADFLRSAGATLSHTEARRVLDLRTVPPGHAAALREAAAKAAAGYSLVTWSGPTPEQHLAGVAQVLNAMNDAPHEEGAEDSFWDADRVRERGDSSLKKMEARGYSVAAIHDETGEMAGLTQLEVNPETPEWGHQGLTAVTRAHRGHRLGLLVKAAMLEWLASAEPEVERIETGNADSNRWMIAVNEALGYEVLDPPWDWLELAVSEVL